MTGNAIDDSLAPLFKEAREKGLWFYSWYAELWFSPDELEAANKAGTFRWGAVNWRLRDPAERVNQLRDKIRQAQAELEQFERRLVSRDTGQRST